jgi:transcriptional regulator with XRE-family HTH domain
MRPHALQRLRRAAGLTQAQVAAAVGVDRVAVARWETGITTPRPAHAAAALAFIRAHARRRSGELAKLANGL